MLDRRDRILKALVMAVKIAIGSCISMIIADYLKLDYYTSAGSIALLSIVTTKWGTVRISIARVLSFFVTVGLAWISFSYIDQVWLAFGLFMFLLIIISFSLKWRDTISVNVLIGTHFMIRSDYSLEFIRNEFLLVLIGISVAITVNLFNGNRNQQKKLLEDMRYVETNLRLLLSQIASYLRREKLDTDVWEAAVHLEQYLEKAVERAYEYHENTFATHPDYYIHYLEMRTKQCNILHNLHYEIKKIRCMPAQAEVVAEYIDYMKYYVVEINEPKKQINRLHDIFAIMKRQALPASHEEFEARAILYHILMDLEEFLIYKKRFYESLSEQHRALYWGR